MNLILNHKINYKDQINYIFDFIFQNINLNCKELFIIYGKKSKKIKGPYIHIYKTDKIFSKNNYLKKKLSVKTEKLNLSNYNNIRK
ncbi:MAG: hypothetical protein ACOCP8_08050, partial [archaeon]